MSLKKQKLYFKVYCHLLDFIYRYKIDVLIKRMILVKGGQKHAVLYNKNRQNTQMGESWQSLVSWFN